MNNTLLNPLQQATVLHEQAAISMLQDWISFLQAQQTLLAPEQELNPFEQHDPHQSHAQAEQLLMTLPTERKALFQRAIAERRAEAQQAISTLPNCDTHDRQVLDDLLQAATEPDASGHVLFPDADGERVIWMELRVDILNQPPDEAAYRAAQGLHRPNQRMVQVAAGAGIIGLVILLIWYMVSPPGEPALAQQTNQASVNGTALQAWPITQLTLIGEQPETLPVVLATHTWPTNGQAAVRQAMTLPLELCAPANLLMGKTALSLDGNRAIPARLYRLTPLADFATGMDVLVYGCDQPELVLSGVLESSQLDAPAMPGAAQAIAGNALTLAAVTIAGPASDPDIPADSARVTLTFSGTVPADWASLAPTLRLADGSQHSAPEAQTLEASSSQLAFLIPLPGEPHTAELRISDPATGQIRRWQVQITPAPDRPALLATTMRVEQLTATTGELHAHITNIGSSPLQLLPTDLLLDWNGMRNPLPGVLGLESPLAANETREIILVLPETFYGTATLQIGPLEYRIQLD